MDASLIDRANQEFEDLKLQNKFRPAKVTQTPTPQPQIRGDHTFWIEEDSPPGILSIYKELQSWIPLFRQNLYYPLQRLEAHLAEYPPGTYYEKHLDQPRAKGDRLITFVLYLNSNWSSENGGELCLYDPESGVQIEKLSPLGGRLVLFLSSVFPHEVLPCQQSRRSLTGWFRSDAL